MPQLPESRNQAIYSTEGLGLIQEHSSLPLDLKSKINHGGGGMNLASAAFAHGKITTTGRKQEKSQLRSGQVNEKEVDVMFFLWVRTQSKWG